MQKTLKLHTTGNRRGLHFGPVAWQEASCWYRSRGAWEKKGNTKDICEARSRIPTGVGDLSKGGR